MTVAENLEMGAYTQSDRATIQRDLEAVFERFPRLRDRENQLSGTLSGGEQQMLAIGRGLMAHPKLLLLDEPSMGLSPVLVEIIFDIIQEINEQGTSILLVEQNAQMALAIADRAYVLETGKVIMQGTGDELLEDPNVIKAYLGGS
jgi:branched-chain amino acid transport system ATP-binding protein